MFKAIFKAGLALTFGLLSIVASRAAVSDIADKPLYLSPSIGVNFAVTIDDSGSMGWRWLPDGLSGNSGQIRSMANGYNVMSYNPTTTYVLPPWPNATGTNFGTMNAPSLTVAFNDGFRNQVGTDTSTVDLTTGFSIGATAARAWYAVYDPTATVASGCAAADTFNNVCYIKVQIEDAGARTYLRYGGVAGCANTNNPNCYGTAVTPTVTPTAAQTANDTNQNFINWYSYYRSRLLLAKSAALRSLATLPQNTRLTCHVLNRAGAPASDCTTTLGVLQEFSGGNQLDLFTRISRITAGSGTPLKNAMRRVGQYFDVTANPPASAADSPWAFQPGTTASPILACRKSYHMMLTDGYYNSNAAFGAPVSEADSTAVTLPDPGAPTYTGSRAPYALAAGQTLADIAFYYWSRNLNAAAAANRVKPAIKFPNGNSVTQFWDPRNDPATWPHLTQYTVALGIVGTLVKSDATIVDIAAGTQSWPVPADNAPTAIDDLWHAAVNSRGEFYSAAKPDELVAAFAEIVRAISGGSGSAAGVSVTGGTTTGGGFAFQSTYDADNWTGEIIAYPVQADGSYGTPVWRTTQAGKIPAHTARTVKTISGTSVVDFAWGSLDTAQQTALLGPIVSPATTPVLRDIAGNPAAATAGQYFIDYLKGDQSRENDQAGGFYRRRLTKLGDILGSGVSYIGARDFGHEDLAASAGGAAYPAYLAAKRAGPKIVVAGANDGMVHFFRANDGVEFYNFVPPGLMGKLHELAKPSYTHKYYVDGQISEADYWTGSAWRSVVVGSTGFGGTGVFAFDVTNRAAPELLWYVDASTHPELGYGITKAQVVRFPNNGWYAVFGNGYESTGGQATLVAIRLSSSTFNPTPVVTKINVGLANTGNGLSPVAIGAGIDAMYAGDMSGQLWRFDLSNATNPISVAFGGNALFVARNAANQVQPITAQPELGAPRQGGVMVHFGSGALYRDNTTGVDDRADVKVQSFYSVWDNETPAGSVPFTRTNLAQMTISGEVEIPVGSGQIFRTFAGTAFNPATQNGWFIDLKVGSATNGAGERVVVTPFLSFGRILFTSYIPTTTDPNCDGGGRSFLYSLDAFNGTLGVDRAFDTNGDGVIDAADAAVGGAALPSANVGDLSGQVVNQAPAGASFGIDCVAGQPCGTGTSTHRCRSPLTPLTCECAPSHSQTRRNGELVCVPKDSCPVGLVAVRVARVNNPSLTNVCMPGNLRKVEMSWREIQ